MLDALSVFAPLSSVGIAVLLSDGGVHRVPAVVGAAAGAHFGVGVAVLGGAARCGHGNAPRGRVSDALRPPRGVAAVGDDGDCHHRERYSGGAGVCHWPADPLRDPALGWVLVDW